MEEILKYPFIFLAGFVVTYLLTPAVRAGARTIGMVDTPGGRRLNKTCVPRGGGIAVFVGFHAACASVFLLPWFPFHSSFDLVWWLRVLLISGLLLGIGLLDDFFEISWGTKLLCQISVAVLAFALDMRVGKILYVELPILLDVLVTVLWIVGIVNAFNLIDGLDGLASGLAIIASAGLAGSMLLRRLPGDALVMLGLMGACLAFLRYNFHPASIFLGDSGSMVIGLVLALVALASGSKGAVAASLGVAVLALGVPILDTFLAVWRRSIRRLSGAGKPAAITSGDTDHLHHRLLRLGFAQRRVAISLYLLNAVLAAVGLVSLTWHSRAGGIFLVAFVVGTYVVLRHLAHVELWDSGATILAGLRRPAPKVLAVISYPAIDMLALAATLLIAAMLANRGLLSYDAAKNYLISIAPVWIGVPFITIALTRSYVRVWSRARVTEFVVLGLAVLAGVAVSVGLSAVARGGFSRAMLTQGVLYAGMAVPLLSGVRALLPIMRDAMSLASGFPTCADKNARRTLIYGAGMPCVLFLQQDDLRQINERVSGRIVGLLDDDSNLRNRLVYGYRVLGGTRDLEMIVREHGIEQIVITSAPTAGARKKLSQVARECNIAVFEWKTDVRPWETGGVKF